MKELWGMEQGHSYFGLIPGAYPTNHGTSKIQPWHCGSLSELCRIRVGSIGWQYLAERKTGRSKKKV